jgi:hypothetical protein
LRAPAAGRINVSRGRRSQAVADSLLLLAAIYCRPGPLLMLAHFSSLLCGDVHRPASEFVDQPPNCSYAELKYIKKNASLIRSIRWVDRRSHAWIDPPAGMVIVYGRRREDHGDPTRCAGAGRASMGARVPPVRPTRWLRRHRYAFTVFNSPGHNG